MKKEITYFDTTEKLLQNLLNCTDKEIDIHFIQEALKTLITISKTQNNVIRNLVDLDAEVTFIGNDEPIIKGMICWIREKKKFGQIVNIDTENGMCTIKVLGTDNVVTVTRSQFNI